MPTLTVENADDDGLARLRRDANADVTDLEIRHGEVSAAAVADLLVDATFPRLKELTLTGLSFELEALGLALADRRSCRGRFDLTFKGIVTGGLRAFADAPFLVDVGHLRLLLTQLSADDAAILAASPHMRELRGLALHGKIGPDGARRLFAAPFMRTLRHLALDNHALGDLGGCLDALDGGPIETLHLSHNALGSETASTLARLRLTALTRLGLGFNPLSDDDCARVLSNPSFERIEVVDLLGTGVAARSAHALVDNRMLKSLRAVFLGDKVGDEAARAFVGVKRLRNLQLIGASDGVVAELARSLGPTTHVSNAWVVHWRTDSDAS